MSERKGAGGAEAALDQQLNDLPVPGHSTAEVPPNDQPPSGGPPNRQDDQNARLISISQLRVEVFHSLQSGMTLAENIYDESGVLLLAAGSRFTARFLQLLRERGINRVRLGSAQPPHTTITDEDAKEGPTDAGLHTRQSRALDERMAGELQRPVIFRPVKAWRRPRLEVDDFKSEARRGVDTHNATSVTVTQVCESLQAGRKVPAGDVRRSVERFVDMAAVDYDLLPFIVAMQNPKDEYLFDHCVNVALLSMAMGYQLGLDRPNITEIGLGGMLHDIGMLRVPESIRLAKRSLTEDEWREVRRHPLHTLDMLADLRGIPLAVKFVGYQAHERIDGGGYPRSRLGQQLHRYAEIVALADVYAAMTHPRPYRKAILPYHATKQILINGGADKFDRLLVRAFLDTVSLFPIGSRVSLSDGRSARTLRANPGRHTRPVVEELTDDGCPTGHIIDLSHDDALRIIQAG